MSKQPIPHIYGIQVDAQGRCHHYHQHEDVVGLKCAACKQYYACFHCHNTQQEHSFVPIDRKDPTPVICGACRNYLTYPEYQTNACPYCQHAFNPKCVVHQEVYFT